MQKISRLKIGQLILKKTEKLFVALYSLSIIHYYSNQLPLFTFFNTLFDFSTYVTFFNY